MPGLELASKLRRSIGRGKIIPREVIAEKMAPFDHDNDGALMQEELAEFLLKHRVGGKWFCDMVAKTLWNFCKAWYSRDVTWIKIEPLSWMVHNAMHDRTRPVRRYKITPEGAMGYAPLEPMEGSRILDGPKAPPPRAEPPASKGSSSSSSSSRPKGRSRPRPSGRSGPRRGRPRARPSGRPGPRRSGPKR